MSIEGTWDDFTQAVRSRSSAGCRHLRGPATTSQLDAVEAALACRLPPDFRASVLLHDGEAQGGGLIGGWRLLPLRNVVVAWQEWKELLEGGDFAGAVAMPGPGVQGVWWHPQWIPITENGAGDNHCLDLEPGPSGQIGQVILVRHDDSYRPVVAPTFKALLDSARSMLQAGEFEVAQEGFLRRVTQARNR